MIFVSDELYILYLVVYVINDTSREAVGQLYCYFDIESDFPCKALGSISMSLTFFFSLHIFYDSS